MAFRLRQKAKFGLNECQHQFLKHNRASGKNFLDISPAWGTMIPMVDVKPKSQEGASNLSAPTDEPITPVASVFDGPQLHMDASQDLPTASLSGRVVRIIEETSENISAWERFKALVCNILRLKGCSLELAENVAIASKIIKLVEREIIRGNGGNPKDAMSEIARGAIAANSDVFEICLEAMKATDETTLAAFKAALNEAIGATFDLFKKDPVPDGVNAELFCKNVLNAGELFRAGPSGIEKEVLDALNVAKNIELGYNALNGIPGTASKTPDVTFEDVLKLCVRHPEAVKKGVAQSLLTYSSSFYANLYKQYAEAPAAEM
jgi:hypothetical protein